MTLKAATLRRLMIKDRLTGDAVSQAAMKGCSCRLDRGDMELEPARTHRSPGSAEDTHKRLLISEDEGGGEEKLVR